MTRGRKTRARKQSRAERFLASYFYLPAGKAAKRIEDASWSLLRADVPHNGGSLPAPEDRERILAFVAASWEASKGAFPEDRYPEIADTLNDPMHCCYVIAQVTAAIAQELTGTVYQVVSGEFATYDGTKMLRIRGDSQHYHAWVMAGHPGGARGFRAEFIDPQQFFTETPTVVWGWLEDVLEAYPVRFMPDQAITQRVRRKLEIPEAVAVARCTMALARAASAGPPSLPA